MARTAAEAAVSGVGSISASRVKWFRSLFVSFTLFAVYGSLLRFNT